MIGTYVSVYPENKDPFLGSILNYWVDKNGNVEGALILNLDTELITCHNSEDYDIYTGVSYDTY